MFQKVAKTVKVDLIYGYGTGPDILNSFYVRNVGVTRNQDYFDTIRDAFADFHDDNLKALQTSAVVLRGVRVVDLDQKFGGRSEVSLNRAGTGAATAAPCIVAGIVHFNGDAGAAPRKGTIFTTGLTEAQVTADALDATFAGTLEGVYDALRTTPGFAVGDALVIVSRTEGFTIEPAADANHPSRKVATPRGTAITNTIASVTVPLRVGVQKRRRPSPL